MSYRSFSQTAQTLQREFSLRGRALVRPWLAALDSPKTPFSAPPKKLCQAVLLAIALLFLCRNLPWHLDNFDQAKQAFTSYQMVEDGRWWYQDTPSGKIATKPPLAGWISAGVYFLTGGHWWNLAWRLPSLLSAAFIVYLLWKKGEALAGNQYGALVAVAAFGFTVFTPRIASLVRTDMLLTMCIFAAGCLVLEKVRTESPWTAHERWSLFGWLLASMMLKGPIAYAFLLPGLVAYAFCARKLRVLNRSWSGAPSWFAPLIFFVLWAGLGIWLSREFYDQVVIREFLGRFSAGEKAVHQPRNPFFYIGLLILRWQPWSLIFIGLAATPEVRAAFRRDRELLWLACWALGGLALMSLVPSKRFDRILPVVPPLCLMLVAMARNLMPWREMRTPAVLAIKVAFGISALYAGASVITDYATHQDALVKLGQTVRHTIPQDLRGRLAVVSGRDEGLLLYTEKTTFTRPDTALEKWQAGELDWLVLPEKMFQERSAALAPFTVLSKTGTVREKTSAYVFMARDSR